VTDLFSPLLEWYRREQRDLPWRRSRDPYAILVSEIMLQQTRVETVIPYYHRFLERFPGAAELAAAPLEEVYEYWAGLGYYRRAKNLQRAAQWVVDQGAFPHQEEELRQLPGVGDYTAAAVASIACNQPAVALDGNALRVLCRVYGIQKAPTAQATRRELKQRVVREIPPQAPGDFTQAIMELGARLCLPRQPRCLACPMQSRCQAHLLGRTAEIPPLSPRRPRQTVPLLALRIWREAEVLLEKREQDPFLAQQWVTPWFFAPAQQHFEQYLRDFPPSDSPTRAGQIRHGITFRDLEVEVWEWSTQAQPGSAELQKFAPWQSRLPRLASKVLSLPRRCPLH
jgi:A/G-specific adenine glycosylase